MTGMFRFEPARSVVPTAVACCGLIEYGGGVWWDRGPGSG